MLTENIALLFLAKKETKEESRLNNYWRESTKIKRSFFPPLTVETFSEICPARQASSCPDNDNDARMLFLDPLEGEWPEPEDK